MNRCYFFHLSDLSITSGKEKYGEGLLWEFSFSWLTHLAAVLKQRSFATPPTQWIGCRISQWHFGIMPLGAGDDSTWNSAALCGVLRQPVCLWLHKAGCHLYEYKYDISGSSEEKKQKNDSTEFREMSSSCWCSPSSLMHLPVSVVSTISWAPLLFNRLEAR